MKSLSLDKPHAIVMVGIPGSGKSFFAEKFAATFNAPYLDQASLEQHISSEQGVNDLIERLLHEFTKTKQSLVRELYTDSRTSRNELSRYLKSLGYAPLFVWVQVDTETARYRSMKGSGVSEGEHSERVQHFSPTHISESALVISGKHTYASQAKIVLKKLSGPRAAAPTRISVPKRNIIVR